MSQKELVQIQDRIRNRGPDGHGIWLEDRIGLAHTRLSVIDLSNAGAQPMIDSENDSVLIFNGEIYNFKEIRKQLETKGYRFRSTTDSEVLLHLYQERGEALVDCLRGMYAFVIWDARKKTLFCARDPYGIKPLYYCDDGKTLRIASQVKALQESDAISNEIDPAGVCGFYLFGHIPEPYTYLRDIKTVPAGNTLKCPLEGTPEIRRFFSVSQVYANAFAENRAQPSSNDALATSGQFYRAIRDSVHQHMVSDVPIGVFLSSGIDSGAILGLMREVCNDPIDALTLTFEDYKGTSNDEAPLAATVAELYGARHTRYTVSGDEIGGYIPKFLGAMDQPSIDGLNTWLISRAAKDLGLKVVLSGLGGDELMGGYPSFRDLPRSVNLFRSFKRFPNLADWFRRVVQALISAGLPVSPKSSGLLTLGGSYAGAYLLRRGLFMPWELQDLVGTEFAHEGLARLAPVDYLREGLRPDPKTAFGRVASLESTFYLRNQLLRDSDWAGMDHSVEIRTPFVDSVLLHELAPFLVDVNARQDPKRLLATTPRTPLPAKVQHRRKTGFTVPLQVWLESIPMLDGWRRVPLLSKHPCHWARRWAYTVMSPIMQAT